MRDYDEIFGEKKNFQHMLVRNGYMKLIDFSNKNYKIVDKEFKNGNYLTFILPNGYITKIEILTNQTGNKFKCSVLNKQNKRLQHYELNCIKETTEEVEVFFKQTLSLEQKIKDKKVLKAVYKLSFALVQSFIFLNIK